MREKIGVTDFVSAIKRKGEKYTIFKQIGTRSCKDAHKELARTSLIVGIQLHVTHCVMPLEDVFIVSIMPSLDSEKVMCVVCLVPADAQSC